MQPTNNHAERALRSAVIYHKLSLGSQSEAGELRTAARLLSGHTTCRLLAVRLPHRHALRQRSQGPSPDAHLSGRTTERLPKARKPLICRHFRYGANRDRTGDLLLAKRQISACSLH